MGGVKFLYSTTCLSWSVFLLVFFFIGRGQFELFYQYKRCHANCFYNKQSWVYAWLTRKPLVLIVSSLIALPLSLSIFSFMALANLKDFLFFILSMLITFGAFVFFKKFFQRHAAKEVVNIVAKRTTVLFSMTVMVLFYFIVSYYLIGVPEYIDPSSLKHTINQASHEVASTCSMTNYFLKFMHELEAVSWFSIVKVSQLVKNDFLLELLWVLFFINNALIFAALARLQLEFLEFLQLKVR